MTDRVWKPFALVWHAVAALLLAGGLTLLVFGEPAWHLSQPRLLQLAGVVVCYAAIAATIAELNARGRFTLWWTPLVAIAGFGLLTLALVLANLPQSRVLLAAGLLATIALAPIPLVAQRGRAMLVAVLAVAAASLAVRGLRPATVASPSTSKSVVISALSDLDIVTYRRRLPVPRASGGAIVPLRKGYLVVDAEGRFARLEWQGQGDSLSVRPLALRAPLNADQFVADVPQAGWRTFRVADLLAQEIGERVRVLVSHHFWHRDRRCWVVRLSETTIPSGGVAGDAAVPGEWRTIFESRPCLPIESASKGIVFMGHVIGGAMALADSAHLLLALGDHELDGVNADQALAQDPAADYGKTLIIDLRSGRADHLTTGHRNPQGLVIDSSGTAWLTEHGPQGGDELNRIERGSNYGWPIVTYGTEYGGAPWPLNRTPGEHAGFRLPVYAWTPSIGPSAVIAIRRNSVPAWQGDLLVASLRRESLWRLRIREGRVIYAEPIPIGLQIRDVAEGLDGRIVLWNDEGVLVSIRPSSTESRGARLFGQCTGCHTVGNGRTHGIGPDLAGIFRRRVASAPGFAYSPALIQFGRRWSEERLLNYLRDPQAVVPGTTMRFSGLPNLEDREALVGYLKSF